MGAPGGENPDMSWETLHKNALVGLYPLNYQPSSQEGDSPGDEVAQKQQGGWFAKIEATRCKASALLENKKTKFIWSNRCIYIWFGDRGKLINLVQVDSDEETSLL